jgi:Ca-activated chloride channel homolog
MRFASPEQFMLLIGVFLLAVFSIWAIARKKRLLARFGDIPLIMRNAPYISFARQRTKSLLLIVGLAFVCVALARLQFGTHLELLKREGLDIIVALDVSNSMLAQDMKPNRLSKAKQEIEGILQRLKGDRIGLVAFAGDAFVQCPLTLDYAAARFLLTAMDNTAVSIQGTSISAALDKSIQSYDQEQRQHKVLLLLTDGEDHGGSVQEYADEARKQGIKVYTVGIGSPAGEPIPVLDRAGNQVGFKKDENGEVIVTRLDDETLSKIALTTGGKYYHASAGEIELDRIFDDIEKMDKKEQEGALVTKYDDRFQWPLLFGMFFIVTEFFLSERKKPVSVVNE